MNKFSRWPLWTAVIVGVLGAALSIGGYHLLAIDAKKNTQARFEVEAETLRKAVERECSLFFNVLGSISELHSLSDKIDAAALEEFADKGMAYQRRVLGPFGLTQGISNHFRAAYERMSGEGTQITSHNKKGELVSAPNRSAYYPLTWQYPAKGLKLPIGFDLGSTTPDNAVIALMAKSGLPQMGGPAGNGCFYGFSPIFANNFGRTGNGRLLGFSVARFDPARILEHLHNAGLPLPYQLSLLPIRDTTPTETEPNSWSDAFDIGGQPWLFSCSTDATFMHDNEGILPEIALGSGLIITILLTLLLFLLAGRTRRVERLVIERTTDLEESHRRLHEEMEERLRLEEELLDISSREKQRIGRDLHDSVGQKLTGAAFLAKAMLKNASENSSEALKTIAEQLKEAISQTRGIARGLAPMELDDGLCPALSSLARQAETVYGVDCSFSSDAEISPSPKVAEHLYRIAQEALNNAIRHGEATCIDIHLSTNSLTICDNGSGISHDRDPDAGMGLRLMQHRAGIIGATLTISNPDMGGTCIECLKTTVFT